MKILTLHLKSEYFDAIQAGTKTEEYRVKKPYWTKRLVDKEYDEVHILKGYPPKTAKNRRMIFPWRGFVEREICHPFFGDDPVKVYAIKLENPLPNGT